MRRAGTISEGRRLCYGLDALQNAISSSRSAPHGAVKVSGETLGNPLPPDEPSDYFRTIGREARRELETSE